MHHWLKPLRNERGAFDVTSIVVGVVLLGILTAGILVNTNGLVPWSQDRLARAGISSLSTVQDTYLVSEGKYGTGAELITKGLIAELPAGIELTLAPGGTAYCTKGSSGSGSVFHGTSTYGPREGDCSAWLAAQTPADPTVASCDGATYKSSSNVDISCTVTVTGTVSKHTLTLTPNSATLAAWSIAVDLTSAGSLSSKVTASGFAPKVDGVLNSNAIAAKTYAVTGNDQSCMPAASCNHEQISTAKAPEIVYVEVTR